MPQRQRGENLLAVCPRRHALHDLRQHAVAAHRHDAPVFGQVARGTHEVSRMPRPLCHDHLGRRGRLLQQRSYHALHDRDRPAAATTATPPMSHSDTPPIWYFATPSTIADLPTMPVVTMHMPQPASSRVPPAKGQYEQHTTSENTEVPQALLEVRKQRVRENSKSKPPSPSLSPTDFHHPQAGHHEGATFYELEAFVNAVQSGGSAVVTIEDGIEAVAMGVAAELSIKEKRVVDMQEVMVSGSD
mmetsp:Transcript_48059/g.134254  ORF Transcript_48059/g.134254 Transcript_48059/m.134254 type:complete len:245 (+) Transcript_48059:831-1565(+)